MPMLSHGSSYGTTLGGDHLLSEEHASRLRILKNTVASYTFEIGIIFHSIFIGGRACRALPRPAPQPRAARLTPRWLAQASPWASPRTPTRPPR